MASKGVLSQKEIDALLKKFDAHDVDESEIEVTAKKDKIKPYDFTRPNKLAHEELRGMYAVYNEFSKYLAMALSSQLRSNCKCELMYIDEQTYFEYTNSIINTSILGIIDFKPLEGSVAVELSSTLANSMINLKLGGSGEVVKRSEAYTEIEMTIIKKILNSFLTPFISAWNNIIQLTPSVVGTETSGQYLNIAGPNDTVAIATFQVTIGEKEGIMNCCMPYVLLEPLAEQLNARKGYQSARFSQKQEAKPHIDEQLLVSNIENVQVEIKCELGKTYLTLDEIDKLQVGDVIKLNAHVSDAIEVHYNDIPKYLGDLGTKNKKYAVRITKIVEGEKSNA